MKSLSYWGNWLHCSKSKVLIVLPSNPVTVSTGFVLLVKRKRNENVVLVKAAVIAAFSHLKKYIIDEQ